MDIRDWRQLIAQGEQALLTNLTPNMRQELMSELIYMRRQYIV
jgi:hypothetical protein